jgi:hypothetical protein
MSRYYGYNWIKLLRFPKYQNLQYGERYFLYDNYGTNQYFRFRVGTVPGISKRKGHCRIWRSQSMAERRKWFDYEQQFKENNFTPRMRRTPHHLISTYDDIPRNSYRGSWKQSTKKRRQWGLETKVIYCG